MILQSHKMLAAVIIGLLLLVTAAVTMAEDFVNDGRLNAAFHMGGSAIYCVDEYFTVSNVYTKGGIRVLGANGQQELFVSFIAILGAGEPPVVDTLLGTGRNAYGPLNLWRMTSGEFVLSGVDEHGKEYFFYFSTCEPQLPNTDTNAGDVAGSNNDKSESIPLSG